MRIEILNKQRKIKLNKKHIKKITASFLRYLRQPKNCILTLVFVSPDKIKKINKRFFRKDNITDVIAIEPGRFNKDIFGSYLGDIVICPQKAKENSKRFNNSVKKEVFLYIAHGILHLLNYDDLKEKDRLKMQKKQQELVRVCYGKD